MAVIFLLKNLGFVKNGFYSYLPSMAKCVFGGAGDEGRLCETLGKAE